MDEMNSIDVQNLLDFSGKSVVVTGASNGIGAGIAKRFAEANAKVIVNFRSNSLGAQTLVDLIKTQGGNAQAIQSDISQREEIEKLVTQTIEAYGHLDIWINNAGIYPISPILKMVDEEWDQVFDINLRSVHLCTQIAAKAIKEQGKGGSIINITSIEAHSPAPGHSHYAASKAAVAKYTEAAALELGEFGIRVNAVAPGLIWREGIETAWPEGVVRWEKAAPLKRMGMPEDIADACLFLASPAARWITGINLPVDGGILRNQTY